MTVARTDAAPRPNTGGTQAVERASALVSMVVRADEPLTFTEISDTAGLARSTTSRLLAALERTDLLQRDEAGGYVAGPLFALHAARHDPWQDVVRVATPYLERLRDETGETVHLAVVEGGRVRHVAQCDSAFLLTARDWTQVDVPEHCSSLGKVLYAFGRLPVPDEPYEERTERTVTTRAALEKDLFEVRRRGYAVTLDELEVGLGAVAAPVRGRDGSVFAALGVSGPTARLEEDCDRIGRLLVEQADDLSALLKHGKHNGNQWEGVQ
jgi:DNA-binding IclR family transcriptional regulator